MLPFRIALRAVLPLAMVTALLGPQAGATPGSAPPQGDLPLSDHDAQLATHRRDGRTCRSTAPPRAARVKSTAYSLRGRMANGEPVHDGAVAMNCVPFGTRYRILQGPMAGKVVTVKDTIGRGSQFDIWVHGRRAARNYGRRTVAIEKV